MPPPSNIVQTWGNLDELFLIYLQAALALSESSRGYSSNDFGNLPETVSRTCSSFHTTTRPLLQDSHFKMSGSFTISCFVCNFFFFFFTWYYRNVPLEMLLDIWSVPHLIFNIIHTGSMVLIFCIAERQGLVSVRGPFTSRGLQTEMYFTFTAQSITHFHSADLYFNLFPVKSSINKGCSNWPAPTCTLMALHTWQP